MRGCRRASPGSRGVCAVSLLPGRALLACDDGDENRMRPEWWIINAGYGRVAPASAGYACGRLSLSGGGDYLDCCAGSCDAA